MDLGGKRIYAVRGAVFAQNTAESILENACGMFNEAVRANSIESDDLVSIHFSLTRDLDALNPATALRKGNCDIDVSEVALFCSQEADTVGAHPKLIRMMLTAYLEKKPKHVYVGDAQILRPDLAK